MEVKQPFTDEDWQATPEPVKRYIWTLEETNVQLLSKIDRLEKRIETLENKSNKNSQNSSKPPSSDSPYKRPEKKTKKSRHPKKTSLRLWAQIQCPDRGNERYTGQQPRNGSFFLQVRAQCFDFGRCDSKGGWSRVEGIKAMLWCNWWKGAWKWYQSCRRNVMVPKRRPSLAVGHGEL